VSFKERLEQFTRPFSDKELENFFNERAGILLSGPLLKQEELKTFDYLSQIKEELIPSESNPVIRKFVSYSSPLPETTNFVKAALIDLYPQHCSPLERSRWEATIPLIDEMKRVKIMFQFTQRYNIDSFLERFYYVPEDRYVFEAGYTLDWTENNRNHWITVSTFYAGNKEELSNHKREPLKTFIICPANGKGVFYNYRKIQENYYYLGDDAFWRGFSQEIITEDIEGDFIYAYTNSEEDREKSELIKKFHELKFQNSVVDHTITEMIALASNKESKKQGKSSNSYKIVTISVPFPVPVGPPLDLQLIMQQSIVRSISSQLEKLTYSLNKFNRG